MKATASLVVLLFLLCAQAKLGYDRIKEEFCRASFYLDNTRRLIVASCEPILPEIVSFIKIEIYIFLKGFVFLKCITQRAYISLVFIKPFSFKADLEKITQ